MFIAQTWSARWTYEVYAFGVFGVVLGMMIARMAQSVGVWSTEVSAALLVLATAWSASLSLYYPTPAFGMGPLLGFVWACGRRTWHERQGARLQWRLAWSRMTAVMTGLCMIGFVYGRYTNVRGWEHWLKPWQLTHPMRGLLRGANGLWTDAQTARFLQELNRVVARVGTDRYAIVPGTMPAYWVTATQPNPLPAVCVHPDEMYHPALMQRLLRALEEQRGRVVILVEKLGFCDTEGVCPPVNDRNPFIESIRQRYARIGETEFFTLYQ